MGSAHAAIVSGQDKHHHSWLVQMTLTWFHHHVADSLRPALHAEQDNPLASSSVPDIRPMKRQLLHQSSSCSIVTLAVGNYWRSRMQDHNLHVEAWDTIGEGSVPQESLSRSFSCVSMVLWRRVSAQRNTLVTCCTPGGHMQPEDVFFRVEGNGAFRLEGHAHGCCSAGFFVAQRNWQKKQCTINRGTHLDLLWNTLSPSARHATLSRGEI